MQQHSRDSSKLEQRWPRARGLLRRIREIKTNLMASNRTYRWAWLIPALLVSAWLGARGLNADAIWYDEWASLYMAGSPPYGPASPFEILARSSAQPWQPPVYYLLLALWGSLAGWDVYALRALSLLAGLLAVAWTYRLGYDLARHGQSGRSEVDPALVGIGAAVALGLSAFFIHYYHELRTYSYHALFAVIAVWAYWHWLTRRRSWRADLILLAALVGLLYSHYFSLLIIGALGLHHLLLAPKTRNWWRVPALMVAAGALFLPWLHVALTAPPEASVTDPVLREAALAPNQIVERLLFAFSNGATALLIVLAAAAWRRRGARLVAFWLITAVGAASVGNLAVRVLSELRYLIGMWPLLALLVGFGTAELARKRVSPALLLIAWGGGGIWASLNAAPLMIAFHAPDSDTVNHSYAGAFRELPWRELRQTILARAQPGDALALHRPDAVWAVQGVFEYYFHDAPVRSKLLESLPGRDQDDEYLPSARQFIADAPRVWLAVDKTLPATFRLREFQRALAADYVMCEDVFDRPNMRLSLYARRPSEPVPIAFGDGIGLHLLEPLVVSADRDLTARLGWLIAPDVPPATYSAALHVVAASGELVGQTDYGVPDGGFVCAASVISLRELPPGRYTLLAAVYDWRTGERLPGLSAAGEAGDRLRIGEFDLR